MARGKEENNLTTTQQNVVEQICDTLTNPGRVDLLGLSGVGKTTIARLAISRLGVPVDLVEDPRPGESHRNERQIIIKSQQIISPEGGQIVVPGMSYDEADKMLRAKHRNGDTRKKVIRDTCGIPLLMNRYDTSMHSFPWYSTVNLLRLAISQESPVEEQIGLLNQKYLQVPFPENLGAAFNSGWNKSNRDLMRDIDALTYRVQESRSNVNISFVAPQSYEIYSQSVNGHHANIDIAIPNFNDNLIGKLDQVMGVAQSYRGGLGVCLVPNSRAAQFGMDERKVAYLVQYGPGRWRDISGERAPWSSGFSGQIEQYYVNDSIKNRFSGKEGEIMAKKKFVFFSAHDHRDMYHNPFSMGLALETWLQQEGIKYYVNNQLAERKYIFDPKTNKIVYF